MNGKTRLIIVGTLLVLGIGLLLLGLVDQQQDIRYVDEILANPEAHESGTYTLLGMPQTELLHVGDEEVPNPDFPGAAIQLNVWSDGALQYLSRTALHAAADGTDVHWTFMNETRVAGSDALLSNTTETWTTQAAHVFLIQGFDAGGHTPYVWAVFDGVLKEGLQPKPSQFMGHVATELDGQPLPPGAVVYVVEDYKAGCSSKFLPDDVAAEYDTDGDGQVD